MGSRKKLVLASLVSLMMVLAFLIGLVPSHTTLGADAASGSQGRPDFVNLLADVLGLKASGGAPAEAISVIEPRTASLVRIPEDSVAAYLQFKAAVDPPLSDPGAVAYVIDGDFVGDDRWVGEYYSNLDNPPTQPPYTSWIDVATLATSDILGSIHFVYALGGAAEVLKQLTEAEIQYTIRSSGPGDAPSPPVATYILEENADVDADNNGLPDALFDTLEPGETWLATYEVPIYDDQGAQVGWALRQVAVVNLDPGEDTKQTELDGVSVAPVPSVSVTAPVLQDFQDAGLIDVGESGLLIVSVADDLSAMLDQVDGDDSAAALGGWAAAATEYAPGGGYPVPGTGIDVPGNYVEISIVATTEGGTAFEEVEELGDLAVDLELRDMDLPEELDVALWSLSTLIGFDDPEYIITNDGELTKSSWDFRMLRGEEQAPNTFVASLNRLSIFAAFESILSIYELYPDIGAVGKETATDIRGDFGDIMAEMTLAETQAAFAVYFGDVEAAITGGLTLLDGKAVPEHVIPVLAPADFLVPQSVDVKVVDIVQPSNIGVKVGGFTYLTEYELVINTTGTGTGSVTPPSGTLFLDGEVATLTATEGLDSDFIKWEELDGSTVIAEYTANPLMIVMDQDREFNAVFDEEVVEEVTLELLVEPAGGGFLEVDGSTPPKQATETFLVGTVVDLLATAADGYDFDSWIGDVVETGTGTDSATGQVTMDADKSVTAVFVLEPVVETYTLTIQPADGGTTVPADGAYDYTEGTVVPISATADADYEFVEWDGPVDLDSTLADNQVTMDADKTVRPVFQRSSPVITSVTPNEAWLFGGIVARIDGDGFKAGATVSFLDEPASVIEVVPPSAIYVIVPALVDEFGGTGATVDGVVTVTNPGGLPEDTETVAGIFTYKRYDIDEDVITTAFYVQDDDPIGLALDVDGNDEPDFPSASVRLPAPDSTTAQTTTPYGLARATTVPAAVHADLIDAGEAIVGIWDFGVHLYENTYPVGSTFNTQSLGIAVYNEIDEWSYDRTQASQTTPPLRASLLEFPVDATGLTAANFKNGLTLWSLETDYNYGSGTSTPSLGTTAYQSTLISGEALDACEEPITGDTDDGMAIDTVVARVYDLSAFSLRAGAIELPDTITIGATLDPAEHPSGTAESASTDGGTPVYIIAPNGGFGWVRVAFGDFDPAKQDQPWSSFPGAVVTNNGQDEFYIECQAPAYPDPNIEEDAVVDIGIYLESDLTNPAVVLEDVFKYKAEIVGPECNICGILLILLGLAAALIGLAAGGDSGGGGGGPCFIATAAYGTPMAADIDTLRAVRDTFLLNSAVGTAFVDAYYHVSPAIADVVAKYPVVAAAVRIVLVPVIWAAKLVMAVPTVSALLAFTAIALATLRRRRSKV